MNNTGIQVLLFVMVLGLVLFIISILFIDESNSNEISETAFECGFEPFFLPRVPFSIHFFSVTVIFLIFDLEVVILMPILFKFNNFTTLFSMTIMVWLLLAGLLVEWFDSSVSWQF